MAENLRVTHYQNGDSIANVLNNSEWASLTTGAFCNYDNKAINGRKYGKLYNWYSIADSRNIAPKGWHVPTDEEWDNLKNYLIENGYNYDETTSDNKIAISLAAKSEWTSNRSFEGNVTYDLSKNNKSGFNALPGGFHRSGGGGCDGIKTSGEWWSTTLNANEPDDTLKSAGIWGIYNFENSLERGTSYLSWGHSIRCIKDSPKIEQIEQRTNNNNNNSNIGASLPSWLQRTNWVLNNQYGVVLSVKFINNDYLMFRMLDQSYEKCEYSIPNNLNCIFFKYVNLDLELWFDNDNQTLETKTGQNLSRF